MNKKLVSIFLTLILALSVFTAVPLSASAARVDPAAAGDSVRLRDTDINGNEYIWEYDESFFPEIVSVITEVHNVTGELVLPTYLVDSVEDRDGGDRFYFADSAFATVDPDIPITKIDFSKMVDSFGSERFMNNIDHFMDVCPELQTIVDLDDTYVKKDGAFRSVTDLSDSERLCYTDVNGNQYIWGYDDSFLPDIVSVITEVHNVTGELVLPTYLVDSIEDRDGGDQFYFADSAFVTVDPDIPITRIDFSKMVDSFGSERFMNNIDHFMGVCPELQTIVDLDGTYVNKYGVFYPVPDPVIGAKCGDIDGDGNITILDVTFIQRKLANISISFEFNDEVADVDGDKTVTILDATTLQRWLIGLSANSRIGEI